MPTIPYVKQTWTEDSSLCNAARNTVHENGLYELSYAPAVRVYHNAAQGTISGTPYVIGFGSERFDQCANAADTMHDTAVNNSRLTCRYAGVYLITGAIQWQSSAAGTFRLLDIRHQGATTIARSGNPPMNTGGNGQTVSALYALAVNEYVELIAQQDTGGALNVLATGNYSPEFMMVRVG